MKLGKRKWVKGGSPERGGFDEKLLSLGGPGGGARRSIKKPKTNINKTSKADSTISGVSEMGASGRSAKLQSRKSGPNIAGDARHKVRRDDLTSPSGADWSKGVKAGTYKADPKFIKKQKGKEAEAKKRIEKERIKEKIGGMVKRAKRDKELEAKIGKKGLKKAKKAYEGLYGDWLKNQGFSPQSR